MFVILLPTVIVPWMIFKMVMATSVPKHHRELIRVVVVYRIKYKRIPKQINLKKHEAYNDHVYTLTRSGRPRINRITPCLHL